MTLAGKLFATQVGQDTTALKNEAGWNEPASVLVTRPRLSSGANWGPACASLAAL